MISLIKLKQQEVNQLIDKLSYFYDCNLEKLKQSSFYFNDKTSKLYIFNGNIDGLNLDRINSLGLYFGTQHDNNRFRLSIDGSGLIDATKNVVILNDDSFKSYVSGENLFLNEVEKIDWQDKAPFLIIKYKDNNLGCCSIKGDEILCYVPKSRRLNSARVF